jgi:hypothetical protein
MASTVWSRDKPLRKKKFGVGQSVSIVVTQKERYEQELGDDGGRGDLDEDDVIEADAVERVE